MQRQLYVSGNLTQDVHIQMLHYRRISNNTVPTAVNSHLVFLVPHDLYPLHSNSDDAHQLTRTRQAQSSSAS